MLPLLYYFLLFSKPILLFILQWLRSVPGENSATERTKILARAKDVPPWVFFPDFERAEWINKIIKNVWSNVEEMVIDAVVTR